MNSNPSFKNQFLLVICAVTVILIVLIGGLTRLYQAGLSIVEWKPIVGIIPPRNELEWTLEFEKYKNYPEYKYIHSNIILKDFKFIYGLEYLHRMLGRLLALLLLFTSFTLVFKKKIKDAKKVFYILILCGLQGAIGWYMVKSGLSKDPYVSHFRLGLHLIMATFIYLSILSIIFSNHTIDVRKEKDNLSAENYKHFKLVLKLGLLFVMLQILFGAFVAGLKAGMIYNEFPLMGGTFVPEEFYRNKELWGIFNDPASIQFLHRINAYIIFVLISFILYKSYRFSFLIKESAILFTITLGQVGLGIATLLMHVPISFALIHQLIAFAIIALIMYIYYKVKAYELEN